MSACFSSAHKRKHSFHNLAVLPKVLDLGHFKVQQNTSREEEALIILYPLAQNEWEKTTFKC